MSYKSRSLLVVIVALAVAALACGPGLTSSGGPQPPVESVVTVPLEGDPILPADSADPVDPADICPQPTEGVALYRSDENGYCFLYPSEFEENPEWDHSLEGAVTLVSPFLDVDAVESLIVYAQVLYTGPAGDLSTAERYADAWIDAYVPDIDAYVAPGDNSGLTRSTATVGGQPAVIIENVPGRLLSKTALLVVGGHRYRIVVNPQPGEFEDLDAAYGHVWDAITESIVFYTPSVQRVPVTAEDVCPAETEGSVLLVNQSEGYCFLYPSEFEQETGYGPNSSWLAIGAPVETGSEMGKVQPRLIFSWFGPDDGQTAMQLTEGFVAETGAPRTEVTVAGGQGVELIDTRAPAPARVLMLVVNGGVYTLVANPYDAERWAEVAFVQDQAWDSVTSTLTFFDKLR